jgi:hypothetical protein
MHKNLFIDDQTLDELASLLALGVLRRKHRHILQNKALMTRKALDFRAAGSIHVPQEQDNEQ